MLLPFLSLRVSGFDSRFASFFESHVGGRHTRIHPLSYSFHFRLGAYLKKKGEPWVREFLLRPQLASDFHSTDDSSNIYSFLNDIHKYFYLRFFFLFIYFSIISFISFLEYFIIFELLTLKISPLVSFCQIISQICSIDNFYTWPNVHRPFFPTWVNPYSFLNALGRRNNRRLR